MTVNVPNHQDGRSPAEEVEPPKALAKKVLAKVVNPILKALLHSPLHGLVGKQVRLLGLEGRKTGRRYEVVVGRDEVNGKLLVPLATTGRRQRLNLRGGAPVEVTAGGRLRRGRGELVEDPEEVARVHEVLLGLVS